MRDTCDYVRYLIILSSFRESEWKMRLGLVRAMLPVPYEFELGYALENISGELGRAEPNVSERVIQQKNTELRTRAALS